MMNICVRLGRCEVSRSTKPFTKLVGRAETADVSFSLVRGCCSSSLSASGCGGNRVSIVTGVTPPSGSANSRFPPHRRLLVMRPVVSSELLHTSVHRRAEDSTAAADNRHLELTAAAARENVLARGTITRVWQASSSVLCFRVHVDHPDFQFRAGQWVDVHIPGMETVGGFSLCSGPHQLAKDGSITLGIKRSEWPPAKWFHQNCAVGDVVELRVGGDFFLDLGESPDPLPRLLLVGGGVGVNPLLSMMHHLDHLSPRQPRATLLFSTRTPQDLLYKKELDELSSRNPNLKVEYFLTRTSAPLGAPAPTEYRRGRMGRADLAVALDALACAAPQTAAAGADVRQDTAAVSFASNLAKNSLACADHLKNIKVCICGPPSMIHDVEEILLELGVSKENLLYEKWW